MRAPVQRGDLVALAVLTPPALSIGLVGAARTAGIPCAELIQPPVGITNAGRRILAAADDRGADLVVLGARGAGLTPTLFGSINSYGASRARVSVCIAR